MINYNPAEMSYMDLLTEQAKTQEEKIQTRTLNDYNSLVFPRGYFGVSDNSAVSDLLSQQYMLPGAVLSLQEVLKGMASMTSSSVEWADMGGGSALAMREAACDSYLRSVINMTNVDLFNFQDFPFDTDDEEYFTSKAHPNITQDWTKPEFIRADIQKVDLPFQPHLITSIEVIQYINDPLAAISNWYNQLADYGALVIATEHDFSTWIRFEKTFVVDESNTPSLHFVAMLQNNNINFAIAKENDNNGHRYFNPNTFNRLVIRKKPGTSMVLKHPANGIWINPMNYKAAYYPKVGEALVEITPSK